MNDQSNVVQLEYWTPEDHAMGLCRPEEIGKPRPPVKEAVRLARLATPVAVKALIETAQQSEDLVAKVKAAEAILNRGWGKPVEHIRQEGETTIKIEWASPDRLSYRREAIDVTPAPPQLTESAPPKAFKPIEQTAAQAMRDLDAAAGSRKP